MWYEKYNTLRNNMRHLVPTAVTAIAASIAAILATPTASADTTVYGKIDASIDYINVDANASFYRPGQEALRPGYEYNKFVNGAGNYTAFETDQVWGQTYFDKNTRLNMDPRNWNPYAGNDNIPRGTGTIPVAPAAYLYNSGEPSVNNQTGTRTAAIFNSMASSGYYATAASYLRSQYPRNVQGWGSESFSATNPNPLLDSIVNLGGGTAGGIQSNAQQAGWVALARQYGYTNTAGANNVALQATQYANEAYNAAYTKEYDRLISTGATAVDAAVIATRTGNIAGNAAYNAYATNAWDAYQVNAQKAQSLAVAVEGANVGAVNTIDYFAAQRARLASDFQIGNVSGAFYQAQSQYINNLEKIALSAAAISSYTPGQQFKGWGMNTSNQAGQTTQSYIGVKGGESLGNGVRFIYQVEMSVDINNQNRDTFLTNGNRGNSVAARYGNNIASSDSGIALRNTFVGAETPYGAFLVGRFDTPVKRSTAKLDLFTSTIGNFNTTVGFQDLRMDNTIGYISPSWNGFQFMGAITPGGGATTLGALDNKNNGLNDAYSLALLYTNGPFYGTVGYESLGSSNWSAQNANYQYTFGKNAATDSKTRIGLGLLNWNGFSLTGVYEQRNNILGAPTKANGQYITVQSSYAVGPHVVKAMWGQTNLQACADPNAIGFRFTCNAGAFGQYFADAGWANNQQNKSAWAIGYDYNFSKRTQGYAVYTQVKDQSPNANWNALSFGVAHSF
jgi:predicted porin